MKTLSVRLRRVGLGLAVWLWVAAAARAADTVLVENGQARCVVLIPDEATPLDRLAATDLRWHLQRAAGVEVPLLSESEAETLPAGTVRLAVGQSRLAKEAGISSQELKPGEFRIRTSGNGIFFLGNDSERREVRPDSPATLYAVAHFLDRYLRVRWLWPGELGTSVPRQNTLALPPLEITSRPTLEKRVLRMPGLSARNSASSTPEPVHAKMRDEAWLWFARHQLGTETEFKFGHSFAHWWDKYGQTDPDLFATPPPGQKAVRPDRIKLCVSNPRVADRIIAEWKTAGMPDSGIL